MSLSNHKKILLQEPLGTINKCQRSCQSPHFDKISEMKSISKHHRLSIEIHIFREIMSTEDFRQYSPFFHGNVALLPNFTHSHTKWDKPHPPSPNPSRSYCEALGCRLNCRASLQKLKSAKLLMVAYRASFTIFSLR